MAWLGDQALEAEGPWTLSCYESDSKATFLEISAALGGGLRLERQVAVLVRDGVVLLADAIEVEVADSGPVLSVVERAWLDRQSTRAARLGGTLEVRACPEGGTALTLRLPRRLTERRAA